MPTIESEKRRALYRSDDGGKNWTKLDASQFMVWRPFYFANLIVDPKDENKVFKPDLILLLSVDGGKSFNVVSGERTAISTMCGSTRRIRTL